MKAVFVTTEPNDVANVIAAWDFWNVKSTRITFDYREPFDGDDIVKRASAVCPDVIFYIGGAGGEKYLPSFKTLRELREVAPSINLIFDGGDEPWHAMIEDYRRGKCFNLQVNIDGRKDCPADLNTTAPVNTSFFEGEGPGRDIFCGISGAISEGDRRTNIIKPLLAEGLIKMRLRDYVGDGYPEHVAFMRRCQMIINTSFTGSGKSHHVKQRVFETGFAGAALLEDIEAPTSHWIPPEYFFTYEDARFSPARPSEIIKNLNTEEVAEKAGLLQEHVRAHYTPQQVYGGMLDRL
ncbi:hypothetical protein LCGC14_1982090 [marine sediment metagenome]|uniref:DUF3880 domain-containing protein n=1 Tax=marine sediment metagenome TaxID=412755 RepID=A0A0F9F8I1_9ZZZZ